MVELRRVGQCKLAIMQYQTVLVYFCHTKCKSTWAVYMVQSTESSVLTGCCLTTGFDSMSWITANTRILRTALYSSFTA